VNEQPTGRAHQDVHATMPPPDPWVSGGAWGIGFRTTSVQSRAAFPWVGAILVLLGIAFLAHAADPSLDGWGLVTVGLGVALCVAWATGRSRLVLWPGVVLLGYGAARVLLGLAVLAGDGWTTVGIGVGFAVGWLALRTRGPAGSWSLVVAALVVLIGVAQLAAELPALLGVQAYVAPVIVIVLGLLLLLSGRRRTLER
jgi:hypothetical protein